ncbi:MAG: DNA polymerase IV [Firmicutes bacterium]|nr:DNA polymerase IV [Bacillota bacterium]
MTNERIILHCDINNFFASVACLENPTLVGFPVVVGGSEKSRKGIVLAKNMEAKLLGIKTGMPLFKARELIPTLITVGSDFGKYSEYSKKIKEIYIRYTPQVESFGMDECWLDITGCMKYLQKHKTPLQIAHEIRKTVKSETGLTISVGLSFTKVFAKLGSDYKKPDAVTEITRDNYKTFVWNMPVRELMGVGRKTNKVLEKLSVYTIGDLAKADTSALKKTLGVMGVRLQKEALGEGDTYVEEYLAHSPAKSVGRGTTTPNDLTSTPQVKEYIKKLSDEVGAKLQKNNQLASGVALKIKDNQFNSFIRQKALKAPTAEPAEIAKTASELFTENYNLTTDLPIRALRVTAINLLDL